MALCHNPHSYDRTHEKNKHGFATPAATKERRALKKAARKFSRACEMILIQESLLDMEETQTERAQEIVKVALDTKWHIDDILEMYDNYERLPRGLVWETQNLYNSFMEGVEIY